MQKMTGNCRSVICSAGLTIDITFYFNQNAKMLCLNIKNTTIDLSKLHVFENKVFCENSHNQIQLFPKSKLHQICKTAMDI